MLKAYAVALVLTTSTQVVAKKSVSVEQSKQTKPPVTTQRTKPGSGIGF